MADFGKMDRKIVIEEKTVEQNTSGAPVETWDDFARIWAQKNDLKGREFFADRREIAEMATSFKIRYLLGLRYDMRILYDGQYYNIVHIAELGRREAMEIIANARPE